MKTRLKWTGVVLAAAIVVGFLVGKSQPADPHKTDAQFMQEGADQIDTFCSGNPEKC